MMKQHLHEFWKLCLSYSKYKLATHTHLIPKNLEKHLGFTFVWYLLRNKISPI